MQSPNKISSNNSLLNDMNRLSPIFKKFKNQEYMDYDTGTS
jgi:hypothetical protein